MFIITAKCSKRRVVKILLIFALLLSLFLALRACRHSSPPPVIAAGTNEERIAYLASLGWEVNDQPIETLSVTLGETLEEPYLSYNDLQRSQGFDLTRYCGQTLSRYTYVVTNYPDASLPCQADLYVCDGSPRATSSAPAKTASWQGSLSPPVDSAFFSLSQPPCGGFFFLTIARGCGMISVN